MPELIIYGASDDCIEVEGVFVDEFDVPHGKTWWGAVRFPDASEFTVSAKFRVMGWSLAIVVDYDAKEQMIPMRVGNRVDAEGDLSPVLILDVPEGTRVENLSDDDD